MYSRPETIVFCGNFISHISSILKLLNLLVVAFEYLMLLYFLKTNNFGCLIKVLFFLTCNFFPVYNNAVAL